mmetsp:Transcript_98748/g.235344  ORF Transcript_98748/g.235344 Transcript_98748/m.235344 type:complete len:217 (-) Transcript_98748:159-809(-)
MAAVPLVLYDITNQAAPDGCDLLCTPETLRTPTGKPCSSYFTEDDSEMYEQSHRVPQSGRPSTCGCRALSEGSCLRRSSVGKSQARRTSILELGPEERIRALGVPERLGHLPRRKQSLGPPQRKQPGAARPQTPREPLHPAALCSAQAERPRGSRNVPSHPFPVTPRRTKPCARARTVGPCTPRSPHLATSSRPERALRPEAQRRKAPAPVARWRY